MKRWKKFEGLMNEENYIKRNDGIVNEEAWQISKDDIRVAKKRMQNRQVILMHRDNASVELWRC